jgi:hypothetical protein
VPIDLLDTKTRSINLTSPTTGLPVDADSTPTYALTLNGATLTPPAVQHGVTGEYYVPYPTTTSGLHSELWTAVVGGVTAVIRRSFTVEATTPLFVDTEEAVAHLRASGVIVSAADLEQLRWLCMVACSAVESDLGRRVAWQQVTETFDGGQSVILLRSTPLISVTTVVESGTTLTAADYTADVSASIIYRGGQQSPRCWAWGRQNVTITYAAGYLIPPPVVRKVALSGVQRMWQSSQQTHHPGLDDVSGEQAIFEAIGTLTPLELAAYNGFRAPGFA